MARLDVMAAAKKGRDILNNRYALDIHGMKELRNNSSDTFELIANTFSVGYMQGVKAAKAELRRGRL